MNDLPQPWRPRHNPWAIALTVTIATFMEVLDTSIANVALPHIAGSLSASQDEATWVLTSYLVANAVILPLSAWLADRVGRKRFYMTCVVLFTISSFLCGLAPSLPLLIFFRILQGLGGGGLATSEQSILADTFEPSRRGSAFALYGMAVVLAPAIGPTLGGWITDTLSWHWIFFINVPVGVLSIFLTSHYVEDPPHIVAAVKRSGGLPIDYVGAALIAIGLGSLEVVLDKGQEDDWFGSPFIIGFASLALVALTFFVVWEWNHDHPILNLRMFRIPNFAVANGLMLVLGGSLFGATVLQPQFLQTLMGYTAQAAGETLTPGGFAVMLCMPFVGRFVSKVDARYMVAFGFLITGFAVLNMTHMYLGMDFWTPVWYRVYWGLGIALLFVPINTLSFIGVRPELNGQVSAMVNLSRNVGGSIGIAVVTTVIARRTQVHQSELSANISSGAPALRGFLSTASGRLAHAGGGAVTGLRQAYGQAAHALQQQAAVLAYHDALFILGAACILASPVIFIAKKNKTGAPALAH